MKTLKQKLNTSIISSQNIHLFIRQKQGSKISVKQYGNTKKEKRWTDKRVEQTKKERSGGAGEW